MKKIISSNNFNNNFATGITVSNETITNPSDIANAFNNFFTKIAIDIQSSIRISNILIISAFHIESFFITLTESTAVSNIISSFNKVKNYGPNSVSLLKF